MSVEDGFVNLILEMERAIIWSSTVIQKELSQEQDQEVFWDLTLVILGVMYPLPIAILQELFQENIQEVLLDIMLDMIMELYQLPIATLQEISLITPEVFSVHWQDILDMLFIQERMKW